MSVTDLRASREGRPYAVGIVVGVLVAVVAGAFLAVYIVSHMFDNACGGFQTAGTTSHLEGVVRESALAVADPRDRPVPAGARP